MFLNVYSWVFLFLILITSITVIYRRVSLHSFYAMGAIWGLLLLFFAFSGAYLLALGQLVFGLLPLLYVLSKIYKVPRTTENKEEV